MILKEGIYEIPKDLVVYIIPGRKKVIVKKRVDRSIQEGDFRCQDCIHRGKGHLWGFYFEKRDICLKRPKPLKNNGNNIQCYFGAPYNKKACEMFKHK